jgi:hypothetical protein
LRESFILENDQDTEHEEDKRNETGEVFVHALSHIKPNYTLEEDKESTIVKTKPVLILPNSTSSFATGLGNELGIFIFRIEGFEPVEYENSGYFCVADTYIILNNYLDEYNTIKNTIYTWIGSEAEADKKFCCAMHAVSLRNQLQCSNRILRQVENEENEEFLELFQHYEIQDESYGTDTALFIPESNPHHPNLYQISGSRVLKLILV